MLPEVREGVAVSDAPRAALDGRGTDEFATPSGEAATPEDASSEGAAPDESTDAGREWFGKFPAYPRNTPEHLDTPDLTTRFYVGLWLPGAGALLTYALMRGNYWAAFVGIELLLVGWFTLAKL